MRLLIKEIVMKTKIKNFSKSKLHVLFGIIALLSCITVVFLSVSSYTEKGEKTTTNVHHTQQNNSLTSRKDFTMFIDPKMFESVKENGVLTVTSIENESVYLTARSLHGTSYKKLCEQTENYAQPLETPVKMNVETLHSAYITEENGMVTTIYCVDDGLGSSIEVKYTMPKNNEEYKESFDILISTFKLVPYKNESK
jgi:hypothetical protein